MSILRQPLPALLLMSVCCTAFWWWLGLPVVTTASPASAERLQCASYTPLVGAETPAILDGGPPIPEARIDADLALLARHFDCIRTYSVTGLEAVPAIARRHGLTVLLGLWVNNDTAHTRREIEGGVALANAHPETVQAVVVGNEVLLRRELGAEQLAAHIAEVKRRVPQPVTYADVWEFVLRHPPVSRAVDFVTIHILPYWEDDPVAVEDALTHVRAVRAQVAQTLGREDILIGETGWPSHGRMREGALPSPENAARFVRGFVDLAQREGWRYNLVEAFDQPWKRANEGTVGGYWGLYDTARGDKQILDGAVSNHPRWPWFAAASALVAWLLWHQAGRGAPPRWWLAPLAMAGGCALGLQLEQYAIDSRHGGEHLWATAVLIIAFAAQMQALRALTAPARGGTPLHATLTALGESRLLPELPWLGLVLAAAVESAGLMFDARYRSFPNAGFLMPALLALFVAWRQARSAPSPTNDERREERAFGLLFLLAAAVIAYNETLANRQALLWVSINLLLAAALLLPVLAQRSRPQGTP